MSKPQPVKLLDVAQGESTHSIGVGSYSVRPGDLDCLTILLTNGILSPQLA